MRLGAEDIEHIKLFDWIRLHPHINKYSFHIANERKCSAIYGNILKKKGVKCGIPDIFIWQPRGHYHGLWIELKAGKNKLTQSQKEFLEEATLQGYLAVWVVGAEAAEEIIKQYFKLPVFNVRCNDVRI